MATVNNPIVGLICNLCTFSVRVQSVYLTVLNSEAKVTNHIQFWKFAI